MAAYPSHPPPDKKKTLHKAVRDLRKGRPPRPHPSPPKKKKKQKLGIMCLYLGKIYCHVSILFLALRYINE